MDQRTAVMPCTWMDHHARRLVDDEHLLVLKQNVQRDILWIYRPLLRRGDHDAHPIARSNWVARLHRATVDGDMTFVDQFLNIGPRSSYLMLRQKAIQSFPDLLLSDLQRVGAHRDPGYRKRPA